MSELIPSVAFSELKKLNARQIKQMKSCEVSSDGKYLFTIVVPQTDFIKTQIEYLCQLSNSVGGEDLSKVRRLEYA